MPTEHEANEPHQPTGDQTTIGSPIFADGIPFDDPLAPPPEPHTNGASAPESDSTETAESVEPESTETVETDGPVNAEPNPLRSRPDSQRSGSGPNCSPR